MKDKDMRNELKDSAYKVWLAGLGALAVAGEEGKLLFRTLVEKGQEFEDRSSKQVDSMKNRAAAAKKDAGQLWEKVQEGFDVQVEGALSRLGVPSRKEIATLTKRVEELTRSLEKVQAKKPAAPPAAKKPAAPRAKKPKVEPVAGS